MKSKILLKKREIDLEKISKKKFSKKFLKKINQIKEENQRKEVIYNLLISYLYLRCDDIECKLKKDSNNNFFFYEKLKIARSKIRLLQLGFQQDFNTIEDLLYEIEKEIENV